MAPAASVSSSFAFAKPQRGPGFAAIEEVIMLRVLVIEVNAAIAVALKREVRPGKLRRARAAQQRRRAGIGRCGGRLDIQDDLELARPGVQMTVAPSARIPPQLRGFVDSRSPLDV